MEAIRVTNVNSNINDTALVFEGGGMRASYTSAFVNVLLENEIYFNDVYGVSAGSSNGVNYLARDKKRTKASFTTFAADPDFGSIGTFLTGKGIFSAKYIYQESGKPNGVLPYNFSAFESNPANLIIEGFDRDNGKTLYWKKKDCATLDDLMLRVRASSSLPFVMPPAEIDGRACYDGGLGEGSGIMVPRAEADGFERFVVVCTRPKGYRKNERSNSLINAFFWRRPYVQDALKTRARRYNEQLDRLLDLEASGRAFVFYAEGQQVESGERNVEILEANYARGYEQAQQGLEGLTAFLQS